MTEQDRKIKKYINAVKRRLDLPGELRERVIRDFSSSVAARREAGQTYEEIVAELGSPKKAAAELNEQMREFVCPKSPWRYAFWAATALGAARLLSELIGRGLLLLMEAKKMAVTGASSVGIIGGADGPTAVFVTVSGTNNSLLSIALLAVGIGGLWMLSRKRRKG